MNGVPAQKSKFADLGVRSLSAIVLIPIVLLIDWLGGIWFELMVLAAAIAMAHEFLTITRTSDARYKAAIFAAVLVAAFGMVFTGPLITLIALAATVLLANLSLPGQPAKWLRLGIPYVALPILALVFLRNSPSHGFEAIIFILLLVWAADTLAYFAGRIIGGPKLAPKLSPKKTWAGLGGAIAGAVLVALVYQKFWAGSGTLLLPVTAAILALVEQAGDILESSLKRQYNVKDSGNLIPGHGGMLDRIDGLMAVAVAAAMIGWLRDPASPASGFLGL